MSFFVASMLLAEGYRPFLDPLPMWQNTRWPWLIIPLSFAVALVYKCARCKTVKGAFRESVGLTLTILFGMIAAAVVLGFVVRGLE